MKRLASTAAALLVFLLAAPARAVDLSKHTLGLGAVAEFGAVGLSVPEQLSVRVALNPRVMAGVLLGVRSDPHAAFCPGLKFDWVLVPEEHMNFFVGLAFALDLRTTGGLRAFDYRVGPGVELFASEWPNLGFLVDFGLAGALVSGSNTAEMPAVTTSLSGFGGAGVHYYF